MTKRVRTAGRSLVVLVVAALCAAPSAWANDAAQLALGKSLFLKGATPPCAVCHTLKDAGAEGAIGPELDEIQPDAERVANAMRNGVGSMPSFRDSLTPAQIEAVARYVAKASRQAAK